ncbi:hypothetical protein DFA_03430 [Cavenderia fasciculata]|uniref:Protein kinase domain-containing protein n=1 Tax=Cavenderia fasciculata TaxID=261658 RepID=F4PHJ8_CACFS|nr:uncharacterized protein DFA_03430 [Cavenderia fasciculata]EGG25182.1 hypothetical protein DFA_03430 [Cavenderia fasciculata]|eukprot:XP_004363033.1 hypothetical protein DFA_03430 [Cavenderia fasciculata]
MDEPITFIGYVYCRNHFAKIEFVDVKHNYDLIRPIRKSILLQVPANNRILLYNRLKQGEDMVLLELESKIDKSLKEIEVKVLNEKETNQRQRIDYPMLAIIHYLESTTPTTQKSRRLKKSLKKEYPGPLMHENIHLLGSGISGLVLSITNKKDKETTTAKDHELSIMEAIIDNNNIIYVPKLIDHGYNWIATQPVGEPFTIENYSFFHFSTILDTLGRIHKKGIIHRDVRASNIIIDPFGMPILIDWGSAVFEDKQDQEVYTGTYYTASDRILDLMDHGKLIFATKFDDNESFVKTFILMSCPAIRSTILSIESDRPDLVLKSWREIELPQFFRDLIKYSRTDIKSLRLEFSLDEEKNEEKKQKKMTKKLNMKKKKIVKKPTCYKCCKIL